MDLRKLLELSDLIRSEGRIPSQERELFAALRKHSDKTYLGLCGPRGAGKTVLLKQYLMQEPQAIYLSLDTQPSDFDLFEAIKGLHQSYGFKIFLLDEVHFNRHIDKHLKAIFDFLNVKIIFTSSVALSMAQSARDLSRRVKLLNIPYFSLREFILFKKKTRLPVLALDEIISGVAKPEYAITDLHFKEYLDGGLLPFALEVSDWKPALSNTLQRVILEDISRVQPITLEETEKILKAVKFIGLSSVDGINPSSLARNLAITNYKAEQYLHLLEQAFIIYRVMPRGTNVLKEPKVLLHLPYRLLYVDYEQAIGGLREEFAIEALKQAELSVSYVKNSRGKKLPDFVISYKGEKMVVEIGGKSKGASQLRAEDATLKRFIFKDGAPYDDVHRPLSALGLLF